MAVHQNMMTEAHMLLFTKSYISLWTMDNDDTLLLLCNKHSSQLNTIDFML